MLTFLPHGVLGLMVAGLLAAYVSTHLDAPQLGHVVPGARLLPPLPADRTPTSSTTSWWAASSPALLMVVGGAADVRARLGAAGVRPAAVGRRRHRAALSAALVLVAHQRLERDRRDGELVRRGGRLLRRGKERARRAVARIAARHGDLHHAWCGWSSPISRSRRTRRRSRRSIGACGPRDPAGLRCAPRRAWALARQPPSGAPGLGARVPVRLRGAVRDRKHTLWEVAPGVAVDCRLRGERVLPGPPVAPALGRRVPPTIDDLRLQTDPFKGFPLPVQGREQCQLRPCPLQIVFRA